MGTRRMSGIRGLAWVLERPRGGLVSRAGWSLLGLSASLLSTGVDRSASPHANQPPEVERSLVASCTLAGGRSRTAAAMPESQRFPRAAPQRREVVTASARPRRASETLEPLDAFH